MGRIRKGILKILKVAIMARLACCAAAPGTLSRACAGRLPSRFAPGSRGSTSVAGSSCAWTNLHFALAERPCPAITIAPGRKRWTLRACPGITSKVSRDAQRSAQPRSAARCG